MKILVIDRDSLTTQLVSSRLQSAGHSVVEEAVKNNAIERLGVEPFDAVFIDPAPLNNARPIILGIRRSVRNYPYIVLMSGSMDRVEALKSGANDVMLKPIDGAGLEKMAQNAERLTSLIARIGDDSEDFPSAGGVIAKSAFNQLFLSCLDRADRYGERSFLVFIGIKNHKDVLEVDGSYAAAALSARLSQSLVRLRRQSDIIAQTGKNEYCLMLQRPQYETEPMEAATRFAEALSKNADLSSSGQMGVQLYVTLVDLPVGALHADHTVHPGHATEFAIGSMA
ncbi:PleD family two-component system response regulator [Micavibrio aeruginosavorus]|uniref:Response regulator n=1 Tax=Micavibrio aeruginosavorus (strain ARL-13) TaxID=856793 RepID=G2KP00_MICAA|nr:response regulator transcription factor [Micavibrio aeruginosavorus]AEP08508.1 response regulator [Micavibrio aeruginosavorus ARL-13]